MENLSQLAVYSTTFTTESHTTVSNAYSETGTNTSTVSVSTYASTAYEYGGIDSTKPKIFSSWSISSSSASTVVGNAPSSHAQYKAPERAIPPIKQIAPHGLIGRLYLRCRLWRIAAQVRKGAYIPAQYYDDLLQLYRSDVYPKSITCKAWKLIMDLLSMRRTKQIVDALIKRSLEDISIFLRFLALENADEWRRRPFIGAPVTSPGVCDVILAIYGHSPSLLHDMFDLDTFCMVITHVESLEATFGTLPQVIDGIARCIHHGSGTFGLLTNWALPPSGECFLKYLLTGTSARIRNVAEHIITTLRPFAKEHPLLPDVASSYRKHPALQNSELLHPTLPLLQFATHLAYHSMVAARQFINSGLLGMIGTLWLHHFPSSHRPVSWKRVQMQNDMQVGCLMLLGALNHHFPSTRDLADELLRYQWQNPQEYLSLSFEGPKTGSFMGNIYARLPVLPYESWVDRSQAVPILSLSLLEVCVSNCVYVSYPSPGFKDGPWEKVLSILSRRCLDRQSVSAHDAAVRILFACAATPEENWRPLVEVLYRWPYEESYIALTYIIQEYLKVTRGPSLIPNQAKDFLLRMYETAKWRESDIVNPIDRFVMLTRQAASSRRFALVLHDAGMPALLEAMLLGHYDCFGEEPESRTATQRRMRMRVCTEMLKELDAAHEDNLLIVRSRVKLQAPLGVEFKSVHGMF